MQDIGIQKDERNFKNLCYDNIVNANFFSNVFYDCSPQEPITIQERGLNVDVDELNYVALSEYERSLTTYILDNDYNKRGVDHDLLKDSEERSLSVEVRKLKSDKHGKIGKYGKSGKYGKNGKHGKSEKHGKSGKGIKGGKDEYYGGYYDT